MRTVVENIARGGIDVSHKTNKTVNPNRADEVDELLGGLRSLILPFIEAADSFSTPSNGGSGPSALIQEKKPDDLERVLQLNLSEHGKGKEGLFELVDKILQHSVNTWDRGFMHKLSGSTNAVGLVSELLLAVLNANLHVYQVSPALTSIERTTARSFAALFGLKGQFAGGITQPGGSAANATALVVARNELFPDTKQTGYGDKKFVIFTSENSHYSLQKAAQICGFGGTNARPVPADAEGRMNVDELRKQIVDARADGYTPLMVNATAGTTVLGAFDPLPEIAEVCRSEGLWFHVDASWGGSMIFSSKHKAKLRGAELADSLTVNPHKMMNVPVTCSFLLTSDLRRFWRANTLPAAYLFHDNNEIESSVKEMGGTIHGNTNISEEGNRQLPTEGGPFWDLADLTLQCGRKGDSLKLALSWVYYGSAGFESQIDQAAETAAYLSKLVSENSNLVLVSQRQPACLQVCFYYAKNGILSTESVNTRRTKEISQRLVPRGFFVDYAPGPTGYFLRPVVHLTVSNITVDALVKAVLEIGNTLA